MLLILPPMLVQLNGRLLPSWVKTQPQNQTEKSQQETHAEMLSRVTSRRMGKWQNKICSKNCFKFFS